MAFPGNLRGMSDPGGIVDIADAQRHIQELQEALVDLASQVEQSSAAATVEGTEFAISEETTVQQLDETVQSLKASVKELNRRWEVLDPPDTIPGHFRYQYNNTTAKANPTNGWFRLNDTTISTSTKMYINEVTLDDLAITELLDNIGPDVYIYIAQQSNPTRSMLLKVTGWTDETNWYTIDYTVVDYLANSDIEWEENIVCTFIFPMAEEIIYQMSIDADDDGLKFVNDEEDPGDPTFYGCDGATGAISKGWKFFSQITVVTNVQLDASNNLQIKTRTAYVFDPGIESAWTTVTGWTTTNCT